jgi:hypothetical protein
LSKLVVQMKGEFLMLVLDTAGGFRATVGSQQSLGESECVSFTPFHSRTMNVAPAIIKLRQTQAQNPHPRGAGLLSHL